MYVSHLSSTAQRKTGFTPNSGSSCQRVMRCTALIAACMNLTAIANAVEIVPPDSSYAGKSHAEWLQDWWDWTTSPGGESDSPFNDVTGMHANVNQSGPVFFLSKSWQYDGLPLIDGNRPPAEERSAIVPAGSAIFVPFDGIIRLETSGRGFDAATVIEDNFNVLLNDWSPFSAKVTVDGNEIPIDTTLTADQHTPYLIQTPIFSLDIPEGSSMLPAFGQEGTEARTLLAQSWEFMTILEPLSVGKHTINVFSMTASAAKSSGIQM